VQSRRGGPAVKWLRQILGRVIRHPGSLVLADSDTWRQSAFPRSGTPGPQGLRHRSRLSGLNVGRRWPCKAVIKYIYFSRYVQQLCSATVSNWRRNTAHNVVPSNLGGSIELETIPVPLLRSARASTSGNCVWNSLRVISVRVFVVYASTWNTRQSSFLNVVPRIC
jgi:hypothetical protein